MRLARVPLLRQLPSRLRRVDRACILFESWHGRYSDSPRAISEELHRRGAAFEHVWAIADPDTDVAPSWATVVRPDSLEYLAVLGRASYVVSNNTMPGYFRKKSQTTYLQTWHGTPLKRIGFDIARPAFRASRRTQSRLRRDVASWNVLISPNRFSTEILSRAFRYEGPVLETGYPRNDVLRSPAADQIRQQVRRSLAVEPEQTVVLYAPTWRDNDAFSSDLALSALADELGDRHVILLRAHHLVAATVAGSGHDHVRDVSRHAEVSDLYLAADVLITDYSSVMFDFAVTGKPMLFFTYDLAEYRDDLRGFYFDFEAEAPGPLLTTTASVVAALRGIDEVTRRYDAAYQAFRERFCHWDDGHAAARVAGAVFGAYPTMSEPIVDRSGVVRG
jgi:CDP-glycerol glycerophosphotransferase